jgi:hypothetical protein
MANVPLLRATMQHIKDHPRAHRQRDWFCKVPGLGMTACFAGRATLLSGYVPYDWSDYNGTTLTSLATPRDAADPGREAQPVRDIAAHLLRLTDTQANQLFDSTNTVEKLERIVEEIAAAHETAAAVAR